MSARATARSAAGACRPTSGAHSSPTSVITSSSVCAARSAASVGAWRSDPESRARPATGRMRSAASNSVRRPDNTASGGTSAEIDSGAVIE